MNARELIDLVAQVHHAYPTLPTRWPPPPSLLPVLDHGGVAIVGESADVYESERHGAPNDTLVCYSAAALSTLLERIAAQRLHDGNAMVVIAIPVDDPDARDALAEDLAARVHMRLESQERVIEP